MTNTKLTPAQIRYLTALVTGAQYAATGWFRQRLRDQGLIEVVFNKNGIGTDQITAAGRAAIAKAKGE